MRFLPFLVALILVSHSVNAADYKWTVSASGWSFDGASPTQACNKYADWLTSYSQNWSYSVKSTLLLNPTRYRCYLEGRGTGPNEGGSVSDQQDAFRSGDSCPEGATYNDSTGSCDTPEPDPCESKAGQTALHEHQIGTLDNPSAPHVPPPGTICESKCQLAFSGSAPQDCYRYADGTKLNAAFCKYQYKYNGISCTDADTSTPDIFDQPPTKPPIDQKPLLTNATNCNDWVTNADGSRTRNCTANETFKQPGTMNCSTSGAALKCTPGTPPPAYSDKDKTQQTTEKANADGSTSTTTTTTTDKTTCYGTKPCTSTSKTETETSGTKPDGTPGDETKECEGDGCTESEEEENKDPSKDPEEGEEEESSVSGDGTCGAAPSCSGDAIQCAMLRQQHAMRCQQEEQDDFPGNKDDIKSLFQGERFQVEEGSETDVSSLFNTGTRFLPASCPADSNFSLTTNGGRTFGISYLPLCQLATDLGYLIVVAASLFFAIYVGRGVGGE